VRLIRSGGAPSGETMDSGTLAIQLHITDWVIRGTDLVRYHKYMSSSRFTKVSRFRANKRRRDGFACFY